MNEDGSREIQERNNGQQAGLFTVSAQEKFPDER